MLLLDIAVRATLVLVVALLAAMAMRQSAAATRHFIWTLAMIGVLALPVLKVAVPDWQILPSADSSAPESRTVSMAPLSASSAPTFDAQPPAVARDVRGPELALALWLLGTCVLIVRICTGIAAVRRLARHARPAGERCRALLEAAQEASGISGAIRLLVSRDIAVPMTWGGTRPLLLLPEDALHWSDERIRVVLLHELAHIRRADWLTHLAGRVAVACHWFNPLVWIAMRAMTRERELACDDFAITRGAAATDYAQHLLAIARGDRVPGAWTIAPAMARRVELEGRLLSVLTPHRREPGHFEAPAITLAGVVLALAIASAAPTASPTTATPPQAASPPAPPPRSATSPTSAIGAQHAASEEGSGRRARAARNAVVDALEDESDDVRERATLALAFRAEADVVAPLLRALKDSSPQVREKAALGLAFRRRPDVTDALLEAARDTDSQVREKAVFALSVSGDPRAVDALIAAAQDTDAQVREKAVQGLALAAASKPDRQ